MAHFVSGSMRLDDFGPSSPTRSDMSRFSMFSVPRCASPPLPIPLHLRTLSALSTHARLLPSARLAPLDSSHGFPAPSASCSLFAVATGRFVCGGDYTDREPVKQAAYSPRTGHAVIFRDTLPSRPMTTSSSSMVCLAVSPSVLSCFPPVFIPSCHPPRSYRAFLLLYPLLSPAAAAPFLS